MLSKAAPGRLPNRETSLQTHGSACWSTSRFRLQRPPEHTPKPSGPAGLGRPPCEFPYLGAMRLVAVSLGPAVVYNMATMTVIRSGTRGERGPGSGRRLGRGLYMSRT